jgi:hypothetical protein
VFSLSWSAGPEADRPDRKLWRGLRSLSPDASGSALMVISDGLRFKD